MEGIQKVEDDRDCFPGFFSVSILGDRSWKVKNETFVFAWISVDNAFSNISLHITWK